MIVRHASPSWASALSTNSGSVKSATWRGSCCGMGGIIVPLFPLRCHRGPKVPNLGKKEQAYRPRNRFFDAARRGTGAMADRLKDKAALVVRAGSIGPGWGNGKATAVAFAREGARVFCIDSNIAAANETMQKT